MSKRAAKKTKTDVKLSAAEIAAQLEVQRLRRLKKQQTTIRQLARGLMRAVNSADGARLQAARALCDGTGWAVFDALQVEADQREQEALRIANRKLSEKLDGLAPQRVADNRIEPCLKSMPPFNGEPAQTPGTV